MERYKSRLVAKGYDQVDDVDYFETFSPVVNETTVREVLTLAITHKWFVRQLNVSNTFIYGNLTEDVYMTQPLGVVTAQSNDLKNGEWVSGQNVTATGISLGCEKNSSVLRGLAKGAKGIAGLGRSSSSLASQFSAAFRFPQKFALDLGAGEGSIYFGDGPYSNQNFRQSLAYTPLLTNSFFPSDYFIDLKSIDVDGSNVTINKGLLSINKSNGVGGIKISTLVPYTTMETSIYKAFTSAYVKAAKARGISTVAPVAPFSVCFNGSTIESRPDGVVVPYISLRMPNNVNWFLARSGSNPFEFVKDNVYCLPYVDGGLKPETSIVIGGYQMRLSILEFDIAKSRVGYSPPIQV
ncbi:basic 7S globulin-like [Papaver somniferum]|uniref:basic 7S globulin-like n=1 Tax=Papaver somniferum TaxID=3469 RepID=UPI000E701B7B|nr:basic 7S globulin-like [Papaver somniferum]